MTQTLLFPEATEKPCKMCGVVKAFSEFRFYQGKWFAGECKECTKVVHLRWRMANPGRVRALRLKSRLVRMICHARSRSRKFGMEIDEDCLRELIRERPERCECCGSEFDYSTFGNHPTVPSLDRIDSDLGYVRGNVAIVCMRCNSIKRDASLAELKNIVAYMERHGIK